MIFLRIAVFFVALLVGAGADAQIAFRDDSSGFSAVGSSPTFVTSNSTTANAASVTVSRPGGTNLNDVLIAQLTVKGVRTITPPAGWTLVDVTSTSTAGNEITQGVFWRRITNTGTEPGSYTFTFSAGDRAVGSVAVYRNVDPVGSPLDVFAVNAGNNATSMTLPTITTTQNNTLLVALLGSSRATNTHGNATGMTEEYEFASGAGPNGVTSSLDDQMLATAGSSGAKTASMGTQNDYVAHLLALAGGSALSIAVPPATAVNDVMIASVGARPCSSTNNGACTLTIGTPAGWNLITTVNQGTGGSFGERLAVYWRVATAADLGATYTWPFAGTPVHTGAVGGIASFSGVDTTSPIVVNAGQATASSLNHAAPSITPTVANTMLVSTHTVNASGSWAPPAGMTEALEIASLPLNDNNGISIEMNYQSWTNAVATGTRTAALSGPNANTGATHMLALRPGQSITHYSISAVTTTVANCDYAQITITGHDANHNVIAPPSGRSLTLSTSTASGVWQGPGIVAGTGAWTPSGANNGSATYLWPGTETSFTVLLRQSAVTTLSINVNDGSLVEGAGTDDPSISFVNSALRISNGANGPASIPTQIAGKPSNVGFGQQTLYLQAVRTDNNTGACVSLFPINTDVSVQVGAQCNNPASCTQNLALTSSALSSNSAVFVPSGAFATSMNFRFTTANAEAPFVLNYGDAGQITLQFRAALPSPPANQFVSGTSNAFVVRPFGFAFFKDNTLLNPIPHSLNESGSVMWAAGDDFPMTIAAYKWANGQDANNDGVPDVTIPPVNITGNGLTPNFAGTTNVSVAANLPGVALGALTRASGAATITAAEWSGGKATISNWRYSEVGNIFLTANASGYLGLAGADVSGNSGLDGTGAANGYVGRFRPKQFAISTGTLTNRSAASCSSNPTFSYMNEFFRFEGFTLTAQNAQGGITQNYTGPYAKMALNVFSAWGVGARNLTTDLTARIDNGVGPSAVAPTGSWGNGVMAPNGVTTPLTITARFKRATPDNPDGPYTNIQFGIAPADSDGTTVAAPDFDVDANGVNEHKKLLSTAPTNPPLITEARFGRLRLENAFGPENRDLPVLISAEYWNGTKFALNTDDSCTSIPASAVAMTYTAGANLAACETHSQNDPIVFNGGKGNLVLTAPGAGNNGSVLLSANLNGATGNYCNGAASAAATNANVPYFLGRWDDTSNPDADANTNYDDAPSARGAFGLYGSQPKSFIYFRENY